VALRSSDDPFPSDPVSVHQAAALVRVSAKTISRRLWAGHLRHWKDRLSGRIRLSKADVFGLFECRVPGGAEAAARARRALPSRRKAEAEAALVRVKKMLNMD
jgi:excisionase family DNA binding protein